MILLSINDQITSPLCAASDAAESETTVDKAELKKLEVGQFIRYCSEDRKWYDALITAIHGEPHMSRSTSEVDGEVVVSDVDDLVSYPCVNLSFVSADELAQDQYGRQMVRDKTSISHYGQYVASGFFWCHPDEEEIAFTKMCEALKDIKS